MIEQNIKEAQSENRTDTADAEITLSNTNNPTQVSYSQEDKHTLEKNIAIKVRSKVDSVITTIETKVQDAVLLQSRIL